MKRTDLLRHLAEIGCILIRHGGKHDWYQNPATRIDSDGLAPRGPLLAGAGGISF